MPSRGRGEPSSMLASAGAALGSSAGLGIAGAISAVIVVVASVFSTAVTSQMTPDYSVSEALAMADGGAFENGQGRVVAGARPTPAPVSPSAIPTPESTAGASEPAGGIPGIPPVTPSPFVPPGAGGSSGGPGASGGPGGPGVPGVPGGPGSTTGPTTPVVPRPTPTPVPTPTPHPTVRQCRVRRRRLLWSPLRRS